MSVIDEYLKNVSQPQKNELERIRRVVEQVVPEAEEVMSYGMPAFKHNKRIVLYFAAFKDHMSIFPASDAMIAAVGEELDKFRTSKGTLQFTSDNPIPDTILKELVRYQLTTISD